MSKSTEPGNGKKNSPHQKTRHHLIPRSRCSRLESHGKGNIKMVERRYHEAWHTLFENMTPFEILICLVNHWAPRGFFTQVQIRARWEDAYYTFSLKKPLQKDPLIALAAHLEKPNRYPDLWTLLWANKTWFDLVTEIVTAWAPQSYFSYVHVCAKLESEKFEFMHGEPPRG